MDGLLRMSQPPPRARKCARGAAASARVALHIVPCNEKLTIRIKNVGQRNCAGPCRRVPKDRGARVKTRPHLAQLFETHLCLGKLHQRVFYIFGGSQAACRYPASASAYAHATVRLSCNSSKSKSATAALPSAEALVPFGCCRSTWERRYGKGKPFGRERCGAASFDLEELQLRSHSRVRIRRSACRVSASALRATEDVENALMELAQTQVRLEECKVKVASLTRARDLRNAPTRRRNSADRRS